MRLASPVRAAPEAPVRRCTARLAPPAAEAPTRAAVCEAETTERVARLALVVVPGSRIAQVFCLQEDCDDPAGQAGSPESPVMDARTPIR